MDNQTKDGKQITRDTIIHDLEIETARRGFVEFPQMLHHPDGRTLTVNTKAERDEAFRGDWTPSPDAALKVKADRDEAERKRVALANAEAANAALLPSADPPQAGKGDKSK